MSTAVPADELLAAAEPETATPVPVVRLVLATAAPTAGAAVMAGGVFNGVSPRFYAGAAGLAGIGVAVVAARMRRPLSQNLIIAAGLFAVGILLVVPSGLDNLVDLRLLISKAISSGKLSRPPVELTPGWIALLGWIMATVGFAAAWTALALRRPALAILLPLPVAGFAAISVPADAQVPSALAVFLLFAVGLGAVSGVATGGGEERLPAGYELRRALRSLAVMVPVTAGLYVLSTHADFLFPHQLVDPTLTPQKPHTEPLSQVPDRVLFTVTSPSGVSGPWVLGTLDVYDDSDGTWRLPPFAENRLTRVPSSGVVDGSLRPGVRATVTIRGLTGAVLPGLPATVGIAAEGPKLEYDHRSGDIRVVEGSVSSGLRYTVVAAASPTVAGVRAAGAAPPPALRLFTALPSPPPAVRDLIAKAPKTSKWDEFDYLRTWVLQNVTAAGAGTPVAVTRARVQDIIGGNHKASPFEIVAVQAMLARWVGLPSRIGYGFDGGDKVGDQLQVRPRNGSAFPEVWFPGYEWVPVIGTPVHAETVQGGDSRLQVQRTDILPSRDIAVPIFDPAVVPAESQLYEQVRTVVLIALPVIALLALLYASYPLARKAIRRAQRRAAARAGGPRARIVNAYAEWRDVATDYGYGQPSDTPLLFLRRFAPADDHTELAWLVTRALWGDLRGHPTEDMALHAEEYARVLKLRLGAAHPITLRVLAALSRLSLRDPFDERSLDAVHADAEDSHARAA